MKLNIGGGLKRYDEFKNVDLDPLSNPDYCFNIETDKWPLNDDSVDEIRAWHILEHIGPGFGHFMQEMYRVCKHGAIIDIEVPHPDAFNFYHDYTHVRPITVEMFHQFSKKHMDNENADGGSQSGHAHILNVDYEIIGYNYVPSLHWEDKIKTMTNDEIHHASLSYKNVWSVIQIKLVVVKEEI